MVDYRIEITDDEGTKLPPILFNDAGNLDFDALRVTAETLAKASNVLHANLLTGGEPEEWTRVLFCRSIGEPALPDGDNLGVWTDEVPEGEAHAWSTSAPYRGGARLGDWAQATRLT